MSQNHDKKLIPEGGEKNAINEIVLENDLKNYTISAQVGSENGENYAGAIIAIDIDGEIASTGQYTELHLILKHSRRGSMVYDFLLTTEVYSREIFMYTEYLPKIYDLQNKYQIKNGFFPVAKIYKYSDVKGDEYLIMENMKIRGFKMTDRRCTLDMDHCVLVLSQLGYYHALSYALKTRDPEAYNVLTEDLRHHVFMNRLQNETFKGHVNSMISKACEAISENDEELFRKTQKLKDYAYRRYLDDLCNGDNFHKKYAILIHGDCWNNNMLFKYDNSNKPIEICFLDWQLSRMASPAIDFTLFSCLCLGSEIFEKHYEDLIQIYYNALTEMLSKCNLKAEIILPLSVFRNHLVQYGGYGVTITICRLPTYISESDEIPDLTKIKNLDEEATKLFRYKSKNHDLYVKRIRGVLKHAVAQNFIQ